MYGCRPTGSRVQQLLAGAFGEVADRALCNPILEMGVDAAKVSLWRELLQEFLNALSAKRPLSQ